MPEAIAGKLRYLLGLRSYLRDQITPQRARATLQRGLAERENSLLRVLELGVYANPKSPYRKLLNHAGIELGDIRRLIDDIGLEPALRRLYDAGVYVTYEELRGLKPIERGSLRFTMTTKDIDNPLLESQYEMQSSGSRGAGNRGFYDLALLAHETSYYALLLEAHGLLGRPVAIWRPVPPNSTGINNSLRYAKLGQPTSRWFSQEPLASGLRGLRTGALIRYTQLLALSAGTHVCWPEHVAQDNSVVIARWLAGMTAKGTPAVFDTSASGATRIALEALEHNLDISGTVFPVGSEPLTPAKVDVISRAGAKPIDRYSASEFGTAALGCATPSEIDDMHLVTDKVWVFTRDKVVDESGVSVPAMVFTTLLGTCPKILLNVESGDYCHLETRECGCSLSDVGLTTHITGLHGYDKLTSEGVTFMGTELYELIEKVLPARFGGSALDYQLVEQENEVGLPEVHVVISPSVGPVAEDEVVETVLNALKQYDRQAQRGSLMANQWRQAGTLKVVRREPYMSGARKVMPLHILRTATPSKSAWGTNSA